MDATGKTSMGKTYTLLKDGEFYESETPGEYAGHKGYKIFGTLDCGGGKNMLPENRVFFATIEDAVAEGYRPCKNCRPLSKEDFERIRHLVPKFATLEEFYNHGRKWS